MRSLGGNIRSRYRPLTLEPTVNFHRALANVREMSGAVGKRFPITMRLAGLHDPVEIAFAIRRYQSVACVTVKMSTVTVTSDFDFASFQDLKAHSDLYALVEAILAIVSNNSARKLRLSETPKIFPLLHVTAVDVDEPDWTQKSVALITRHDAPNRTIVEAVFKKNEPHQIDNTLLLIDRQGVLGYVPTSCNQGQLKGNLQRYRSAAGLLEFAHAIRSDLEGGFRVDEETSLAIAMPEKAIPNSISSQRMWELTAQEFSLVDELRRKSSMEKPSARKVAVIVTVTDVETHAVLRNFEAANHQKAKPIVRGEFVYQSLGTLGDFETFLTICDMGTSGLLGSQENVRRSIDALGPSYVLMVGIAFGINENKQNIGDVLVSKQLMLYDLQRINDDDSVTLRGDRPSCSSRLLNWVKNAKLSWHHESKIIEGVVLSGNKLVDNRSARDKLVGLVPDAIGGEMEGAGLYVACQLRSVDWILVKGICDWADGKKAKNKKARQEKAAETSSIFVVHLLKTASDGQ
ncbi:nucleoside phosphorylase [Luteibacter rhizovicinus]|uniref:Nucleoside phosphorylase n=1 Tax=Luteibacter rhizovicinus TaxID=242606 RepID=A0A4R3Z1K5_9GAMM|nr:hypothetical protein [Luteibacter rhizovicinus]TCV97734.1 nucleoside phosphorylase [Luteibacter rhizovicinus]